ncbi:hypothetical protein MKW92_015961 [Papaver armeniacum]|nr:hypothetical protein MKW92_015961 [Papaver armeniacum]
MYPWSSCQPKRYTRTQSIAFDPHGRGPYLWTWRWENRFLGMASLGPILLILLQTDRVCNPQALDAYVKNEHISEGVPLKFTNDLDIDDDRNIYFTDSSVTYQRRNFIQLVSSGDNTGRLLKYNPYTKETTFKDKSFLIICEGSIGGGLLRCLPFYMDFRIMSRTNDKGEFWVAIHCRSNLSYITRLRDKIQYLLSIGGRLHGMLVKSLKAASEVEERDGKLWISSVLMPFVAVYQLD